VAKNAKRRNRHKEPQPIDEAIADENSEEAGRVTADSESYPIYILRLGATIRIVFPEGRQDLDHPDFWEQTVSFLVARYYEIPPRKLVNLPYCQRRARVVGDKVYYGETPDPQLLRLIRETIGNPKAVFWYDDHETRIKEEVRELLRLLRRRRSG
jgi:hypothetical protein